MAKRRNTTPRVDPLGETGELRYADTTVIPNFVTLPARSQGQALGAQLQGIMSNLQQTTYQVARLGKKGNGTKLAALQAKAGTAGFTDGRGDAQAFKDNLVVNPDDDKMISGVTQSADGETPYSIDNSPANRISGPGGLIQKHGGDVDKALAEYVDTQIDMATAGQDPTVREAYAATYYRQVFDAAYGWHNDNVKAVVEGELNDHANGLVFGDPNATVSPPHWKGGKFNQKRYYAFLREDPDLANQTNAQLETHLWSAVDSSIDAGKTGVPDAWDRGLAIIAGMSGGTNSEKKQEYKAKLMAAQLEHSTGVALDALGMSMYQGAGQEDLSGLYSTMRPAMPNPNGTGVEESIRSSMNAWATNQMRSDSFDQYKTVSRLIAIRDAKEGTNYLMPPGSDAYNAMTQVIGQTELRAGAMEASMREERSNALFNAESDMVEWLMSHGSLENADGTTTKYTQGKFQTYLLGKYGGTLGHNVLETLLEKQNDKEFMNNTGSDASVYGTWRLKMMDATSDADRRDIVNDAISTPAVANALGKTGLAQLIADLETAGKTQADRHDPAVTNLWNDMRAEYFRAAGVESEEFYRVLASGAIISNTATSTMKSILTQMAKPGLSIRFAQLHLQYTHRWEKFVRDNKAKIGTPDWFDLKHAEQISMSEDFKTILMTEGAKFKPDQHITTNQGDAK